MSDQHFHIRKASGVLAEYEEAKLKRSLQRTGADEKIINLVLQELKQRIYEGMPTKNIFKIAYKLLKQYNRSAAARYSLKQAMLAFGPSGYPFEYFFAEILRAEGYNAETGLILTGKCITHEIDVVASLDHQLVIVECKYHSEQGAVSDVKIPLYIHSRFRDVTDTLDQDLRFAGKQVSGWIATNTRFSDDAMDYGRCAGLNLISWDYPMQDSLRNRIDRLRLYPLSCMSTLSFREKTTLLEKGVVLVRHIARSPNLLDLVDIAQSRRKNIIKQARMICENGHP